jgi:putative oxidoreductase
MKKVTLNLQVIEMITASILVLLWVYSVSTRLQSLELFKAQMANQVFSEAIVPFLVYATLATQVLALILLLFSKTRLAGFSVSLMLMLLFTGYVSLVLFNAFSREPCHCISFIPGMTFTGHLFFNLFFTAIAVVGLIITLKKERRNKGMDAIVSHAPLTGCE